MAKAIDLVSWRLVVWSCICIVVGALYQYSCKDQRAVGGGEEEEQSVSFRTFKIIIVSI